MSIIIKNKVKTFLLCVKTAGIKVPSPIRRYFVFLMKKEYHFGFELVDRVNLKDSFIGAAKAGNAPLLKKVYKTFPKAERKKILMNRKVFTACKITNQDILDFLMHKNVNIDFLIESVCSSSKNSVAFVKQLITLQVDFPPESYLINALHCGNLKVAEYLLKKREFDFEDHSRTRFFKKNALQMHEFVWKHRVKFVGYDNFQKDIYYSGDDELITKHLVNEKYLERYHMARGHYNDNPFLINAALKVYNLEYIKKYISSVDVNWLNFAHVDSARLVFDLLKIKPPIGLIIDALRFESKKNHIELYMSYYENDWIKDERLYNELEHLAFHNYAEYTAFKNFKTVLQKCKTLKKRLLTYYKLQGLEYLHIYNDIFMII